MLETAEFRDSDTSGQYIDAGSGECASPEPHIRQPSKPGSQAILGDAPKQLLRPCQAIAQCVAGRLLISPNQRAMGISE
jgi:hypothetical protein